MKREYYKIHSFCQGLDDLQCIPEDPPYVNENNEIQRILKEIFSPDSTGLPQGDIAYFLSPDGNPQIKEWLLNNLLSARCGSVGPSSEGVTDDLLEEMSLRPNESIQSYRERIYQYGLEAKAFIDSQKPKEE